MHPRLQIAVNGAGLMKTASPLLDAAIARGHTGLAVGRGLRCWTPEDAAAVRRRLAAHLIASVRNGPEPL